MAAPIKEDHEVRPFMGFMGAAPTVSEEQGVGGDTVLTVEGTLAALRPSR